MDKEVMEILMGMQQQIGTIDERTMRILEQTTKTNGRVDELEGRVDQLERGRDISAGAAGVKSTLLKNVWGIIEKIGILIFGVYAGKWFK
jgi:hypothetical protein